MIPSVMVLSASLLALWLVQRVRQVLPAREFDPNWGGPTERLLRTTQTLIFIGFGCKLVDNRSANHSGSATLSPASRPAHALVSW